jgi:membrane peptidoglycan carboxypeptidase
MGKTNLRRMNGEFTHTFYERGKPVRSFSVGPSNPSFTPISDIPEMIQKAVMTGEDPAFFGHNGFYSEAIRQSIAQNYVRKRFARGGSTISMQLVKNVFLSRKKTLARKAEEILIVWLIESQRLTSKSRMFEVYLNIIEWGPGVFGVGEASHFYFAKPAAALEPLECAFLASIVPMPKSYAYFVDSAGYVSQKNWNFVAIRNNMIRRGDISAADSGSFNVKITGPAVRGLRRPKQTDSSLIEENEAILDLGQ